MFINVHNLSTSVCLSSICLIAVIIAYLLSKYVGYGITFIKEPNLPYYLSVVVGWGGFIPSPRVLELYEMQTHVNDSKIFLYVILCVILQNDPAFLNL